MKIIGFIGMASLTGCVSIAQLFVTGGGTSLEDFGNSRIHIPYRWELSKKNIAVIPGESTFSETRVYRYKQPDSQEWNCCIIFWPGGQFLHLRTFFNSKESFEDTKETITLGKVPNFEFRPGIYRLLSNSRFIGEYSYSYPKKFSRIAQGNYDEKTISVTIEEQLKYTEENVIMERLFSKTVDFDPVW